MISTPSVYDYLDYRAFIQDYVMVKQTSRNGFSYRLFAKLAGFRSPSYVRMVLDGTRNIKAASALSIAKACQLDAEATRYFETLVRFCQATSSRERDAYYKQLGGFRHYRMAHKLEIAHADYYSNWYVPAIYELALRPEFKEDPAWIAQQLLPRITKKEASTALDTLMSLRFLERSDEGKLVRSHPVVSTGPELQSMHIANYHRSMLSRAAEAIDAIPPRERDISSLTVCVGPDEIQQIKTKIQAFRQELLEIAESAASKQRVVQINFQLFPLTQVAVSKKDP